MPGNKLNRKETELRRWTILKLSGLRVPQRASLEEISNATGLTQEQANILPRGVKLTNREIGEAIGVSESTVKRVKRGLWADPLLRAEKGNKATILNFRPAAEYLADHPPSFRYRELTEEARAALWADPVDGYESGFFLFNELVFPDEPLYDHEKEWFLISVEVAVLGGTGTRALLICAPPRHAKSHLFTVRRTIWRLSGGGRPRRWYEEQDDPPLRDAQVMVVQRSESQADAKFLEIDAHLTENRNLTGLYGRFKAPGLPWQTSKKFLVVEGRRRLHVSGDYSLSVFGTRSAILGRGASDIVPDDPFDLENSNTPYQLGESIKWLRSQVFTRREPGGVTIGLGAKLPVPDEPYTQMSYWPASIDFKIDEVMVPEEDEYPRFFHTVIAPAVKDWEKKEVLCPERWPFEALMVEAAAVGAEFWEPMYMQNPEGAIGATAQRPWIYGTEGSPGCLDRTRAAGKSVEFRSPFDGSPLEWVRLLSVDTSQKGYWSLLLEDVPIMPDGGYHPILIELIRSRLDVESAIDIMRTWHARFGYRGLVLEQNNAEHFQGNAHFRQFLADAKPKISLIPHTTGDNKNDRMWGKSSLSKDFRMGQISIPDGDFETRAKFLPLVREAIGELSTEDCLMSLWFPKWQLHEGVLAALARADRGLDWPGWGAGEHIGPPPRLVEAMAG